MNKKTIFVLLTLTVLIASLTAINAANTTDSTSLEKTASHTDTQNIHTTSEKTQQTNTTQTTLNHEKTAGNTNKELKNTSKTTKTINKTKKENNTNHISNKKNLKSMSYPNIQLSVPSKVNYAQNIVFTATITDSDELYGRYYIYLDEKEVYTKSIIRGSDIATETYNIGKTSAGIHKIKFKYESYYNEYHSAYSTAKIRVLNPTAVTTQYLNNTIYNTKIKVKVYSNDNTYPNGLVRIYSDNKLYATQLLSNGETIFNLKLPDGVQQITAKYVGSSKYMPSQRINTVNILKDKTSISTSLTKSITSNTSFRVNVRDSSKNIIRNGNIQVLENGKVVANGKLVNGVANVKLVALPGNHTYTFKYLGDTNHYQSTQTRTVRVYKTATSMNIQVLKNTPEALVKVTVRGVDKQLAFTGGLHVVNNGKVISVFRIYNGVNTVKLNLNEGSQKVTFKYLSNQYYNPSTKIQTINTARQRTSIQVATRKAFSSNTTFTVKVLDQNKKPVPTGNVQVLENGKVLSNKNLNNGVTNVKLVQNPGNHTYTFKYIANKNYKQSQVTKNVRIYKMTTTTSVSILRNTQNALIQATVLDNGNSAVTKGTVEVHEYGKVIAKGNVKNGKTTINIKFKPGNHNIRVNYQSNNIYNPSTQLLNINILREDTTTTITATKTLTTNTNLRVNVKDSHNNLIKKGNIQLIDNYGDVITSTPLSNGIADINLESYEGYYTYTARYTGDKIYAPSEDTISIHVYKPSTYVYVSVPKHSTQNTTVQVTVKDQENKLVKNGEINIEYYGEVISTGSLNNGKYTASWDLPNGSYDMTIRYLGSDKYESSVTYKTIDVDYPKESNLDVNEDYKTIVNNKDFTIKAYITDENGKSVESEGKVTLYIDSEYKKTVNVVNGVATIKTKIKNNNIKNYYDSEIYDAKLVYESDQYESSSDTLTLTLLSGKKGYYSWVIKRGKKVYYLCDYTETRYDYNNPLEYSSDSFWVEHDGYDGSYRQIGN